LRRISSSAICAKLPATYVWADKQYWQPFTCETASAIPSRVFASNVLTSGTD
jgi:hypothetical protein